MPNLKIIGLVIEIAQGQSTGIVEWEVPSNSCELQGVDILPENPQFGDEVQLSAFTLNDVLLVAYGENCKLSSKTVHIPVHLLPKDDTASVMVGVKIKVEYTAIDTNGRKCIFWLRTKM